jgi:hypothetical protein
MTKTTNQRPNATRRDLYLGDATSSKLDKCFTGDDIVFINFRPRVAGIDGDAVECGGDVVCLGNVLDLAFGFFSPLSSDNFLAGNSSSPKSALLL